MNFWSLFGWIILGFIWGAVRFSRQTERASSHARQIIDSTGPDTPEKRHLLSTMRRERHAGILFGGVVWAGVGVVVWTAATILVWITSFLPDK
jgi:hypothetical protein